MAWTKRKPPPIQRSDVKTAVAQTRATGVVVHNVGLNPTLFSAHAPQRVRPLVVRKAWWDSFGEVVASFPEAIVGMEANATCDKCVGHCVGGYGLERATANTPLLYEFLDSTMRYAPSSWEAGDRYKTWSSHDGIEKRIDYVLLPWSMMPALCDARFRPAIDLYNRERYREAVGIAIRTPCLGKVSGKVETPSGTRRGLCRQ